MSAGSPVPTRPSAEELGTPAHRSTSPAAPAPRADPRWADVAARLLFEIGTPALVFFVPRADVARGLHPSAEPVVVTDAALAHRHAGVEAVAVIDPPDAGRLAGAAGAAGAIPIYAISARELIFHPNARRVAIVEDRRTNEHVPHPAEAARPKRTAAAATPR